MFPSIATLSSHLTPLLALVEAKPAGGSESINFLPLVLIGGLAWFLLIAPERKQRKARTAMLSGLQKNDSVVTTGGLYGVITRLDEESVTLRVDKDVHVRVQRGAVAGLPNADESKAAESKDSSETKS